MNLCQCRITSYNVCYTKLLRPYPVHTGIDLQPAAKRRWQLCLLQFAQLLLIVDQWLQVVSSGKRPFGGAEATAQQDDWQVHAGSPQAERLGP